MCDLAIHTFIHIITKIDSASSSQIIQKNYLILIIHMTNYFSLIQVLRPSCKIHTNRTDSNIHL
jgi:hypothetical protein